VDDNVKLPQKFISYYDLDHAGADPYPFMIITMGSATHGWEAEFQQIASDDELRKFLAKEMHAAILFAALRSLHPVRFKDYYMYIPVKERFFEVIVPFDG
jgi:hypothetical protein